MSTTAAQITWNDVRQPYIPNPTRLMELPEGLARAIARIELAIGRRNHAAGRTVPSAGACYPYEILISPAGSPIIGIVDLHRRNIVSRNLDRGLWGGTDFVYFLVGRPWFSMRKYGRRGYFYYLIDVGHAVLNLSLVASDPPAGPNPIDSTFLEFVSQQAVRRSGALLAIGALNSGYGSPPVHRWVMLETSDNTIHEPLSDIEEMIGSFLPTPPEIIQLYIGHDGSGFEIAGAIGHRRSAARLYDLASPNVIEAAFQRCVELCDLLIPGFGMPVPALQIFSRVAEVGTSIPDSGWINRALLGQTDLAGASSFIAVHSTVQAGPANALSPWAQRQIIASGISGEIVYLVATHAGLGVTGIGGIDPNRWAELCRTNNDVLYLLALGKETAGEKFDSTSVDGRHG